MDTGDSSSEMQSDEDLSEESYNSEHEDSFTSD